ncbi:MAG: recombinase family protein [Prevotella sp.]|nr:recombinase family protein [Prevotella sp.]
MKTNNSKRNHNYAVAYCRFSSDKQRDESIEAQKRAINLYAEQNNITVLKYYEDKAQSAKDDKRIEFQRMVREMPNNNVGTILVHKMDRFSRNIIQFLDYEQKFTEMGVEIIYVAQPEMNNKFVKMMYATMAEQFLDNLSSEVTKGMIINAEHGKRNGSVVPYGYKVEPLRDADGNLLLNKNGGELHKVVIDPEQAEAVKLIFQMTIDGHTRAKIIETLTRKGYRKTSRKNFGKEFTGTCLDKILRNERYTGEYDFHYNKGTRDKPIPATIRVTQEFPAIISKETFATVLKILQTRKHHAPVNAAEEYLLTGKIFCGECKRQYNGMRCKRHGKMYVYYKCDNQSSYKNGHPQKSYCHNNSIQKSMIEQYIINELKQIVFNDAYIDQVYAEYEKYVKTQAINTSMIETLKHKLQDIENSITNIVDTISRGYTSPSIMDRLTQLENEKNHTFTRIQEEKNTTAYISTSKDDVRRVYRQTRAILDSNDFAAKKRIIANFVNKIIVYQDKVEVYINLIPTVCCATLDLDILKTHLCSGELLYGDWNLDSTNSATNLAEYHRLCSQPNAKFAPILPQNSNADSVFTTDNHIGQPIQIKLTISD